MSDDFNAEYVACYQQYCDRSAGMRPYEFYTLVTSNGVSRYFATCLLRDCYEMSLSQCKQIMDLRVTRDLKPEYCEASASSTNGLCEHLSPVLKQLKSEYDVIEIANRNGKGWGYVSLVSNFPHDLRWGSGDLPDCVKISIEHHMISCCECWSNIADHDQYVSSWG